MTLLLVTAARSPAMTMPLPAVDFNKCVLLDDGVIAGNVDGRQPRLDRAALLSTGRRLPSRYALPATEVMDALFSSFCIAGQAEQGELLERMPTLRMSRPPLNPEKPIPALVHCDR